MHGGGGRPRARVLCVHSRVACTILGLATGVSACVRAQPTAVMKLGVHGHSRGRPGRAADGHKFNDSEFGVWDIQT